MSIPSGKRLGPYQIADQIGAGGMGEVYRATDTRLGRTVAVKVLPEHLASDPGRRERFAREAQAVSSLNHPHISALYDVGEEDGVHYLVMEHVEGETLQKRLEKGPLPVDEAIEYAAQMADALEKAHQKGIVHRDLKPSNVMLASSGVKLLDFGLAKWSGAPGAGSPLSEMPTMSNQGDSEPLTEEGSILGTFRYMAPEQLEGKEADARTDIYALCLVLHEMITGKRVFEDASRAGLIAAILKEKPSALNELQPVTPPQLDRVVQTGLEKDPDKRWQSAREVKHALEWIGLEQPATPGAPAPAKRQGLGKGVAASLAVVAVAATVWALWPTPVPVAETVRFEIPIPENANFGAYIRLSPDGRTVAFTTRGPEGGIWVRDIDSLVSRRLPGTEGVRSPFWSPDSRSIAFGVGNELKRIDLAGGGPQTMTEVPYNVGSGAWSPDGVIIFIFGTVNPGPGLFQIGAAGGVATELTRVDASREGRHTIPTFLPDGRHFIYFRQGRESSESGIHVGALDVAPEEQSVERLLATPVGAYYGSGYLFFMPEAGTLMAQRFDAERLELAGDPVRVAGQIGTGAFHGHFSASANGTVAYRPGASLGGRVRIAWFDRSGAELAQVLETDDSRDLSISPDGRWGAVTQNRDGNQDIWHLDLEGGATKRLTANAANDSNPEWSPDGRVVFSSNRGNNNELYVTQHTGVAGSEMPLEGLPEANPIPSDWSPDGRFILFESARDGRRDIWAVTMDGEGEPFPVVETDFDERGGQFSPNGSWIAYQQDLSGRHEIYVQPFPDGAGNVTPVSSNGGIQARWGPDGSELFYVSLADGQLMRVPIELPPDSGTSPEIGTPEALFPAQLGNTGLNGNQIQHYAVSPDGERFLMVSVLGPGQEAPITVILNWNPENAR